MTSLLQDLSYSLRMLRRAPGFYAVALLCIAIGLGANTAMFSVVSSVLLNPLAFPDAQRLVLLQDTYREESGELSTTPVSRLNFMRWRERQRSFSAIGAAEVAFFNLTGSGEPERVRGALVSAELLPLLGVPPLKGRTFTADEEGRSAGSAAPVVVIGHAFWRDHLAADPAAVGKTLMLDGKGHTIVGIMPAGFAFPDGADNPTGAALWVPMSLDPGDSSPLAQWHTLVVAGRLAPGITVVQAQKALDALAGQLARELPESNAGWGIQILPMRQYLVGDVRPVLLVLMAAVGFVLAIACVNLANLQLVHALARRGELAVRVAMGCSRRRLLRQMLTESVMLAVIGGALGLVLARLAVPPLLAANPSRLSLLREAEVGWPAFAFGALASIVTGTLVGLAPALRTARLEFDRCLQEGGARVAGRGAGGRVQRVLVVAQVAVAVVLLAGAGVLLKSLLLLQQVDPGFPTENLLTFGMIVPETRYPELSQRVAFVERALERIRALPGVKSAGSSLALPIANPMQARFSVEGRAEAPGEVLATYHRLVSAGYLETVGIPLVRGRTFTPADDADAAGTVVVSEEMARRYWPGQDALGRRLRRWSPTGDKPWLTVIGIVRDVKDAGLDAAVGPTWYLPYAQHDWTAVRLAVRTNGDPLRLVGSVRAAIAGVDKDQAIFDVATMEQTLADSLARRRFSTFLVSLFAGLGLVMMVIGLYGVVSHLARQRIHELGVRMALGAQARSVLALVVSEGLTLAGLGLVLGLAGTVLMGRLLTAYVFALKPTDPLTLAEAATLLAAAALLASLIPARQATRLDPWTVLKS